MSRRKFAQIKIFAIGLIIVAALVLLAPEVAYARLPSSYVDKVQEAGYEWWSDILALSEVKSTVDGWFENDAMYDFSSLEPVVIAVIDSGIDAEHDLFSGDKEKTDESAGEFDVLLRDNDGNVVGRNTVQNDRNVSDVAKDGHGTHVAGIAATLIHSLGLEKYIKIMPVRAGTSDVGGGASFAVADVKEGIEFALEHGADVVNMSIESTSSDFDIVSDEWAKSAIFVAAAGNGRSIFGSRQGYDSAYRKCYPAASENVIGVMNISNERDEDGGLKLSASSNYGDAYDLCAPGSDFFGAAKGAESDYVSKSGTSMAAPVVAFASALALLKFRASEAATHVSKSVEEVKEIVKFSYSSSITKNDRKLKVLDMAWLADARDDIYAKVDVLSGKEKQHLGDVSPVKLKLNVLPATLYEKGRVEWALNDPDGECAGEGFEFTFTPENAVADIVVYARWTPDTDEEERKVVASRTVVVRYVEFTQGNVDRLKLGIRGEGGEVLTSVPFDKKEGYVLTFEGADNFDPDIAKGIRWYANGKQIGTGKQVVFKPDGGGKYEIYVSVNGISSGKCVVEFKADKTLAYVAYALIAASVLIVIILVIVRVYGSFRAKKSNVNKK